MILGSRSRIPWFELSILLVLMAMGWILYDLNHISRRQSEFEREFQSELADRQKAVEFDFQRRIGMLEAQWDEDVLNWSNIFKGLFDTQTAYRLHEAHLSFADRLEAELPDIQEVLIRAVSQKSLDELFVCGRKIAELRDWLRTDRRRLESELSSARNQELVSTNSDLRSILQQVDSALTNYSMQATVMVSLARTTLDPDANTLPEMLAAADRQIKQLLGLAKQAREHAGQFEGRLPFVPNQVAMIKRQSAHVPGDSSMRLREIRNVVDYSAQLQAISWALFGAIFGLSVFLGIAIYRHVVEGPLREKLLEKETMIEHQKGQQALGGLAHEIRNPLTAINARLYSLQRALSEESAEHHDADVIRSEIDRLDRIVNDYLKLARPAEPRLVTLKSGELLDEVRDLLGPDLQRKEIALKVDSGQDGSFRGDPQQLKQVLINLVQNAAEAIGHDGAITLRSRHGKVRLKDQRTQAVLIEVEDTGPGIPPDVQEKLFDPFFSTKEHGTGLGLPIAARILEKHQGTLQFETRVGRGTVFRVVLPVSRKEKYHGSDSVD